MTSNLSKTDNYIFWLTRILLGLCLATPLFVSSGLLYPYTATKAFGFRILVEVAAFFYLYLVLRYAEFRPRKNIFIFALAAFLLIWFLSAFFGDDFYLSWWGSLERMLGVWGLLHFAVFFLLLVAFFREKKEWRVLFQISLGVSALVSLLAIIQRFVSLGAIMPQVDRVFGTIGNADFLAGYLIFNLAFAAYLFLESSFSRRWEKLAYAAAFLLQGVALVLSGTRGALIGFFVGVVFCLLLFCFFWPSASRAVVKASGGVRPGSPRGEQKNERKYFLISLALILFFGAVLYFFRTSDLVKNFQPLSRLVSISSGDTSVQNRLILWQKAWVAWQQKPILGWGPENYTIAINKYFDPRLIPYEAFYDRAHNFIFDYGVATGWLGLLSYLFLMGLAGFFLWKISLKEFYFSVIFGALLLAYLAQNFFVFDTFVTFLMLFFSLAAIYFFYYADSRGAIKSFRSPLKFGGKSILAAAAIILVFISYSFSLKPILASSSASQALNLSPQDYGGVSSLLENSFKSDTFASSEIVYQIALDYLSRIQTSPALAQNENFYKISSEELARVIEQEPEQVKYYIVSSWLDLYFSGSHPERIDEAIVQASQAKTLSPTNKDPYMVLLAAYFFKNDRPDWQAQITQAQKLSPILGQEVQSYAQQLIKQP